MEILRHDAWWDWGQEMGDGGYVTMTQSVLPGVNFTALWPKLSTAILYTYFVA
jgi:hypothetical protein